MLKNRPDPLIFHALTKPIKNPQSRNCPLCNQSHSGPPFYVKADRWILKICSSCQFVYLENAPCYSDLQEQYAWEKMYVMESNARRKREPIIAFLSQIVKGIKTHLLKRNKIYALLKKHYQHGIILDVGCAAGEMISTFHDKMKTNFIPVGIEISDTLAQEGNLRLHRRGGRVIHADAASGLSQCEPHSVAMIIMSSFLEHEIHPGVCLKKAYEALCPQGIVIVKVPNFDCIGRKIRKEKWCGYRFPDHVNYFTPSSLSAMAVQSGFTIRQFDLWDRLPTSDNMYMVLQKTIPLD